MAHLNKLLFLSMILVSLIDYSC